MEHLIPDIWFQSIDSTALLFVVVAFTIAVLGKGADWLVDGASQLAYELGIGKMIVGATIVSLGTTAPEAAVSVLAAWSGNSDLALGNAIGSIVCDTALIFGLSCLLVRLPADHFVLNRHGWIQLGSGVLLALLCFVPRWMGNPQPVVGQTAGMSLLFLLGVYLWFSIYWSKQHGGDRDAKKKRSEFPKIAKEFALVFIGLAIVLLSSRVLIGSVTELAIRWEIPKSIIAATIVAFGTSLPELVTAISSIKKGHVELLVGNVLGADILNVLFVVGASATAADLEVPENFYIIHIPIMLTTLVMFRVFASMSKRKFQRWMGAPLLSLYVVYLVVQFGAR